MGRSIIAVVDGSPDGTRAASIARRYARVLDRRLVLAFVAQDPHVFPYGNPRRLELARRRAIADGAAVLRTVTGELDLTDVRHRIALAGNTYGAPADRLAGLAIEEDADLVVTSASSTTESLAEIGPCPVVVVPSTTAPAAPVRHGVGVFSGDAGDERAQLVAGELARALAVPLFPLYDDKPAEVPVVVVPPGARLPDLARPRAALADVA